MTHWTTRTLLMALLILPALVSADPLVPASQIRIAGVGGAQTTIRILSEAFQKIHATTTFVMVPALGSSGSVKALLAGAIDLAIVGRPLKEAERDQGVLVTDYARTPFVFATASQSNVSAITLPELVGIYSGELQTWPDGRLMRLVLRPETEPDTENTKKLSSAMRRAVETAHSRKGMIIANTDQESALSIETIPGAIGTTSLAQIISEKRALQPLALDGVAPSLKHLADGSYRYFKTFSLVSTTKTDPLVRQFIAFVRSPAGQQILEKNGQSPVSAP